MVDNRLYANSTPAGKPRSHQLHDQLGNRFQTNCVIHKAGDENDSSCRKQPSEDGRVMAGEVRSLRMEHYRRCDRSPIAERDRQAPRAGYGPAVQFPIAIRIVNNIEGEEQPANYGRQKKRQDASDHAEKE